MGNEFYAMMSRMKYIERWALMRNSRTENICEHSLEVAMLAHAFVVIGNTRLGKQLDAGKAALIAMYHDTTEIITGDMPTPIKYYNEDLRDAFQEVEEVAAKRLLGMLPEDLRASYETLFFKEEKEAYLWSLVKAADKVSAYIKCVEERKAGNKEFVNAEQTIKESLFQIELEEVKIFLKEFLPMYDKTLDELSL